MGWSASWTDSGRRVQRGSRSRILRNGEDGGRFDHIFTRRAAKSLPQYHDDGEKELGPTVATLGLGGPASMTLRMKEKHWNGYTTSLSKGKLFDPDAEIIPNSYLEEERRKLKLEVETGLSREDAQKKFDKLLKKTDKKKSANCPAFLKMRFLHGDIIIMQGAEVQKYFEVNYISAPSISQPAGLCSAVTNGPAARDQVRWGPALCFDVPPCQMGSIPTERA